MIKEILKRIDRAGDYIANGIESAIWVSAWRVTGPEQVKQRDRLALGYLYQGFRNAKRQWERIGKAFRGIEDCLIGIHENKLSLPEY